jgi:tetratricopeptide (TPR) repeat protein
LNGRQSVRLQTKTAGISFGEAIVMNNDELRDDVERGVALGKSGQHKEALAAFDTALKLNPDNFIGHYNRGIRSEV